MAVLQSSRGLSRVGRVLPVQESRIVRPLLFPWIQPKLLIVPASLFLLYSCSTPKERFRPGATGEQTEQTLQSGNRSFRVRTLVGFESLLTSFESTDLVGDVLLGWTGTGRESDRQRRPEVFPVTVRILNRGKQAITLRPGDFRLNRGQVSVSPLSPSELVRSYEARSMLEFPFEFRILPVRPGIYLEPAPFWKRDQGAADTSSSAQRTLRQDDRIRELERRFQSFTLNEGESTMFTLCFPLPVPDSETAYVLHSPAESLPPVSFFLETILKEDLSEGTRDESMAFGRALQERRQQLERDRRELYDVHRQLHEHADFKPKPAP